jgi:hypothetical protein
MKRHLWKCNKLNFSFLYVIGVGKGMLRKTTQSLTDALDKCMRLQRQRKGEVKFSYELDDAAVVAEVDAQLALLAASGYFDLGKRDDFLFFVFLIRGAPVLRKSVLLRMSYLQIFTVLSKVKPTEYKRVGRSVSLLTDAMSEGELSSTVRLICDLSTNGLDGWIEFVAKKINEGRRPNSTNNSNPWLWILDVANSSLWSAPYGKRELKAIEMLNY